MSDWADEDAVCLCDEDAETHYQDPSNGLHIPCMRCELIARRLREVQRETAEECCNLMLARYREHVPGPSNPCRCVWERAAVAIKARFGLKGGKMSKLDDAKKLLEIYDDRNSELYLEVVSRKNLKWLIERVEDLERELGQRKKRRPAIIGQLERKLQSYRELAEMVWEYVNVPTKHNEKELGDKAREILEDK